VEIGSWYGTPAITSFTSLVLTTFVQLDPSTNVCHLNVRIQARTPDGHSLYVHYNGILKINEAGSKVLSWAPDAKSTNYGDQEWFSGPIVETSDPKLKWMETSLFVGQGRFVVEGKEEAVEYEIYKVTN
jgi:hypothetical protein